jgi:hypothetical protein
MRLLERHILDRFRLRFFFQNLRIALLLFSKMLFSSVVILIPENRMVNKEQVLHMNL